MILTIYAFKGKAIIPTSARTEIGLHVEVEPVEVIDNTSCTAIAKKIETVIRRGNPLIPLPKRNDLSKPVIFSYAGVKSWKLFQEEALCWELFIKESATKLYRLKESPDGRGFEQDKNHVPEILDGLSTEVLSMKVAEHILHETPTLSKKR